MRFQASIRVASTDETPGKITMRFEVSDTGAGISPEAQSRIFDEFSQADGSTTRKHGGSGLGLAISKQLVEMMGGQIHVQSTLGAGSTFWFTCSFDKQDGQSHEDSRAGPLGMLTGVRALIVESTAVTRSILQSQMSNWGMTNRIAETSEEAIELLALAAARSAPYDIVVTDMGLDSLEFARTIRARAWRRAASSPASLEAPDSPSLIPSIRPRAEAGAPSVDVRNAGRRAVGTSCPRSESRLAAPMPRTPGVSHSGPRRASPSSSRSAMRESMAKRGGAAGSPPGE